MKLVLCIGVLTQLVLTKNVFAQDTQNSTTPEQQLQSVLFECYNSDMLPSKNTTTVELGFSIQKITNLNLFEGTISLSLWMYMKWNDGRLTWDPASYDNITSLRVPKEDLWEPDLALYGSTKIPEVTADAIISHVYNDGTVFCVPPLQVTGSCQLDLSDYPYDSQTCSLKWGSWAYNNGSIALKNQSETVELDFYHANPLWEMVSTKVVKNSMTYPCCPEAYDDVTVSFTLRRRETHGRIASAVITAWLLLVIFIGPSSGGERVVFAGFIFVALIVLTSSLSVVVPAFSTTRLGRFLLAGMLMTAIITVINALLNRLYPRDPKDAEGAPRFFLIIDVVGLVVTSILLAIITGSLFA